MQDKPPPSPRPPRGVQTLLAVTPAAAKMSPLLRAEAERIRLMERRRLGGDGEGKGMVAKRCGKKAKKNRKKK